MFTEYEIQKIIRENIELREENSKLKITIRQLKSKKTAPSDSKKAKSKNQQTSQENHAIKQPIKCHELDDMHFMR